MLESDQDPPASPVCRRPLLKFVRIRKGPNTWVVQKGMEELLDKVGRWGYQDWLAGSGVTRIQEPTTRLALLYRRHAASAPVFVKVSRFIRRRKKMRSLLRHSDSDKDWHNSVTAWSRGLPTPQPIGLGEQRQWGMLQETYYITEALEGYRPSLDLFHEPPEGTASADWIGLRRDFLVEFGRLVRRLQGEGLIHRQLGPLNILVRKDPDRPIHVSFTDNKHMEIHHVVTPEHRLENLVRTYYQWLAYLPGTEMRLPDIFRFLRDYRKKGDPPLKDLFGRVVTQVYRQADRYAHRNMVPPPIR